MTGAYGGVDVGRFDRSYLWHYRATPTRVIDGDTFVALVDIGFGARYQARIRVEDLWTPEMLTAIGLDAASPRMEPGGQAAKARLTEVFDTMGWGVNSLRLVTAQRKTIVSEVYSMERWVADVYLEVGYSLTNLRDALIEWPQDE